MTQRINPAPTLTLANGVEMPQLGLGTWPMNDAEAAVTVAAALDMGRDMIMRGVLALSLTREAPAQDWITKEWDINGEKATIAVRK